MPPTAVSILWPDVPVSGPLLAVTGWLWGGLEVGLLVRDRIRGKGATSDDRGTRRLSVITIVVAVVAARAIAVLTHTDITLRLPGPGQRGCVVIGLVVMWLGLGNAGLGDRDAGPGVSHHRGSGGQSTGGGSGPV